MVRISEIENAPAIRFAKGFDFCQSDCSPKASGRRGFEKRIAFPKSKAGALAPGQRLLGNADLLYAVGDLKEKINNLVKT